MNDTTLPKTPMFLCTRPQLSSELLDRGYECKIVAHPFRIGMKAWLFPLTVDLAEIVAAHYDAEGKLPPKQIRLFLSNEGGERHV